MKTIKSELEKAQKTLPLIEAEEYVAALAECGQFADDPDRESLIRRVNLRTRQQGGTVSMRRLKSQGKI